MLVPDELTEIEYLYGIEEANWFYMNYKIALEHKIRLSQKLIEKLYAEDLSDRDIRRINDIVAAIKFNEKLLEE